MDTPNLPAIIPNEAASPVAPESSPAGRLLAAWLAGRSPTTIRAYRSDLAAFAAWAWATDPGDAAARLLAAGLGPANELALNWQSAMLDGGLSSATVNRRLAALRSLVALANTLGMVPWQLAIPGVKSEPRRDSRGPGTASVRKLMIATSKRGDAKGARDLAILRLLFDLGLRRAEVCRLDLGDLALAEGTIAVRGKGKREKISLRLPPRTLDAMISWNNARPAKAGLDANSPLFVSLDRAMPCSRLSGVGVYQAVRYLGEKIGIRVRPHGLRHAAVTACLDAAHGDAREVRKFSRHRSIETVMRYDDSRDDGGYQLARKVSDNV